MAPVERAEQRAHLASRARGRRRRRAPGRAATARRACCLRRRAPRPAARPARIRPSRPRRSCVSRSWICVQRQPPQVELQAARQHGHRQLLRIGGREQELDVRRRLLERLQQRVERVRREHVHFVDQVDLVAAARRRVLHVVEQLARVVDLGARGRVHFEQVDEAARVDVAAGAALAAGLRRHALLAVQRLGEDARDRGLADAARAGEQERVVDAARVERVRRARGGRAPARRVRRSCAAATCGPGRGNSCGGSCSSGSVSRGGGPRQNTPGTRRGRYRCSLPGLAGFTAGRREGSDASHHEGRRLYTTVQPRPR